MGCRSACPQTASRRDQPAGRGVADRLREDDRRAAQLGATHPCRGSRSSRPPAGRWRRNAADRLDASVVPASAQGRTSFLMKSLNKSRLSRRPTSTWVAFSPLISDNIEEPYLGLARLCLPEQSSRDPKG